MALPLDGITVVEVAQWAAGPTCGLVLADWGAEVIKVEHPVRGDGFRGTLDNKISPASDINYHIELYNRNKKSVGLDLKHPEGRKVAYRIVERADVFISNFQAKELDKFGLDYTTLSQLNPRLIYAHLSAYGESGPRADSPGFDSTAWARSGMMATCYEQDMPSPPAAPRGWIDRSTGTFLAGGIVLALFERVKSGRGQKVSTSLFGSAVWIGSRDFQYTLVSGKDVPRLSRRTMGNPLTNIYRTKDGRWIFLIMLQTDVHWPDFCAALDDPRLPADPRFSDHFRRCDNNLPLIALLDEIFASRPLSEWLPRFEGRNLIWDVMQSYAELAADPQVAANELTPAVEHPRLKSIKLVATPIKMSRTAPSIRSTAPELGQHTEEVLLNIGYTWDDLARLKEAGVIN